MLPRSLVARRPPELLGRVAPLGHKLVEENRRVSRTKVGCPTPDNVFAGHVGLFLSSPQSSRFGPCTDLSSKRRQVKPFQTADCISTFML